MNCLELVYDDGSNHSGNLFSHEINKDASIIIDGNTVCLGLVELEIGSRQCTAVAVANRASVTIEVDDLHGCGGHLPVRDFNVHALMEPLIGLVNMFHHHTARAIGEDNCLRLRLRRCNRPAKREDGQNRKSHSPPGSITSQ